MVDVVVFMVLLVREYKEYVLLMRLINILFIYNVVFFGGCIYI